MSVILVHFQDKTEWKPSVSQAEAAKPLEVSSGVAISPTVWALTKQTTVSDEQNISALLWHET